MWPRDATVAWNDSGEFVEERQNVPGLLGDGMPHLASLVSLEEQAGDSQTAQVLAGGLHFDLQLFRDFTHTHLGMTLEKFENLNPSMIGKSFDNPLKPLGAGPRPPNHAFGRLHDSPRYQTSPPCRGYSNILKNVGMVLFAPRRLGGIPCCPRSFSRHSDPHAVYLRAAYGISWSPRRPICLWAICGSTSLRFTPLGSHLSTSSPSSLPQAPFLLAYRRELCRNP